MPLNLRKSRLPHKPAVYGFGLVAVALALWLEVVIAPIAPLLALTPLSLAAALTAWYGGFTAGGVALLVAAAGVDFLLLEPGSFLSFGGWDRALAVGLYLASWLVFSVLVERGYRQGRIDRETCVNAERQARQANRISELTAALGQARTPAMVIEAALQEPLHALGAEAGVVFLTGAETETGNPLEVARSVAFKLDDAEQLKRLMGAARNPVSDAIDRAAPVILDTRGKLHAEYPELPADLYPPQSCATVAVPFVIGSRVVGVVRLDFRRDRQFSAEDREYLYVLGKRAAQALDRTWQYETAQRARVEAESLRARADQELAERQKVELALRASEGRYRALAARTSRLHGLTAGLSESVTMHAVAQAIVHQGKIVVGATTGDVTLLVENGTQFETLFSENAREQDGAPNRFPAETGYCATQAVQTGRGVFIGSFNEWQEHYWRSASIAADGGFVSSATLPLMIEGTPIGVLAFHFTVPVNFDESYRALLLSVAQHCAQALDRARLYESAQRARADAEAANRLKDEFVSIVSHELRTPLNAMLGWTSMLQRGSLDPAVAARALQSIHDNATRQTRLIDELLDFSRIVGGRARLELEEIDLRDLIRGVVESMIPAAAAHGIELQLSVIPAVTVIGDLRRLEQVFFNLLGNALKFTPKNGRVTIDTRLAGRSVEIRVIDSGVGIEPEFLPYVFDRFRQADSTTTRSHGGLGLGLSIARQLVEAHKGTIAVESEGRDRGSSFIVRLPVAGVRSERGADKLEAERAAAAAPRLDGIRILVVDDEPDTREIMAHTLEGCGATVTLAGTASDAMTILEDQEMDVLLADIAMPGEDGYALIRRVRASGEGRVATIPAAAVTAHARDEEKRQAISAGFQMHLAKPFEPAELAQAVETLVRGTSVVH
jgi:signal transduction histidine kinase/ActR/RegA family two-component response regulator